MELVTPKYHRVEVIELNEVTNGNSLDWDYVTELNVLYYEMEKMILEGDVELEEDGTVPDEVWVSFMDSNPTIIYYPGEEVNMKDLMEKGIPLEQVIDWFIVHYTNGNEVELVGEVPREYLTEEYLREREEE